MAPVQSATRAAALTAAFGVADSISRVEALTALAPQLPEVERSAVLTDALDGTQLVVHPLGHCGGLLPLVSPVAARA